MSSYLIEKLLLLGLDEMLLLLLEPPDLLLQGATLVLQGVVAAHDPLRLLYELGGRGGSDPQLTQPGLTNIYDQWCIS
jgi:hypothetical protein